MTPTSNISFSAWNDSQNSFNKGIVFYRVKNTPHPPKKEKEKKNKKPRAFSDKDNFGAADAFKEK